MPVLTNLGDVGLHTFVARDPTVYGAVQRFSQASTASCHCTLFWGLSTQWFSSGKCRNSLGMPRRCSAVKAALDDEHWHRPVGDVIERIEALVIRRMFELRAAVFRFLEPELFRGVVHETGIEDAIVIDEALPRFLPHAGHPIHHVAAVTGAQGTGAIGGEKRELRLCRGPTLLQIFEWAITPVSADRVGKGLSVAGGAVEIDRDNRKAGARVGLRIPAIVEVV